MLGTRMGKRMKYQKDTQSPKWNFDQRTATTLSQRTVANSKARNPQCATP